MEDQEPDTGARLPYLTATCKEILRLKPVIPETARRVADQPLEIAGYELPVGTILAPCFYLTHRRPDLYPNPDVFRPERFLDRTFRANEWVPFGGGDRKCLGFAFAQYEMKIVLHTLLSSWHLRLQAGQEIVGERRNLSVGPSGGVGVVPTVARPPGP